MKVLSPSRLARFEKLHSPVGYGDEGGDICVAFWSLGNTSFWSKDCRLCIIYSLQSTIRQEKLLVEAFMFAPNLTKSTLPVHSSHAESVSLQRFPRKRNCTKAWQNQTLIPRKCHCSLRSKIDKNFSGIRKGLVISKDLTADSIPQVW